MVGSSLGYDPPAKRDEIFHRLSRFILVYKSPLEEGEAQKLVAYSTFRFDREDEDNVVYCYELQVDEIMRGVGIGRKLMGCLESVAEAYGMDKVMLTNLANEKAFRFYMQCGFKVDESSPSLYGEEVDYEILSKVVSGADL
ncbi:hypothetical protein CC1G_06759 [Coprinopsis cinerea okayama7|uniref:N-alpha-acetyltransferase 40 n=1 Tax=Coprinopsis cinerea (strain Okayama-7 / 130 / ATCC MYA-4618 / FGSC 9003) TaxID=240176 RepID=A8N1J3_COPC7|nr:hypothetical protein CC1G_06759 [Coprinopsis cinerea okayama7\|eukprot:XP_001828773.2 hypothetical protein CC1G_06759 [Coprinopsis cinerea okayama7\